MKIWRLWIGLALFLSLAAPSVAQAQPQTGTIYGTVTDGGGHFYPLYARLEFYNLDTGVSTHTFTNPANGQYVMDLLPEGNDYSVTVATYLPGYETPLMTIYDLTSSGAEANFAIPPAPGCTAPGYHLQTFQFYDFEADFGPFTVQGSNPSWEWGSPSGSMTPPSGVKLWATNLDGNYNNNEFSSLQITQDTGALSSGFTVSWWDWYQLSPMDSIRVLAWNGSTWQERGEIIGGSSGWTQQSISFDPSFARSDFSIRFELQDNTADAPAMGWYIDDFKITTPFCVMDSGGLVYGYVSDQGMPPQPVLDAQITSNGQPPFSARTAHWQDSPYPGLYVGFQMGPPFSINMTASHPFYAPQTLPVTVLDHGIVWVDFALPSAVVEFNEGELSTIELPFLGNGTATLTLNNTGTLPVQFSLLEALDLSSGGKPLPLRAPTDAQTLFGFDLGERALVSFQANTPGDMTTIATLPEMELSGGDLLLGNPDWIYALRRMPDTSTELVMISTTQPGQFLSLGSVQALPGHTWQGLTGGMDGNFYAVSFDGSSSQLYRISPSAQVTPLGDMLNGLRLLDVAMNREGLLYALDAAADMLIQLDPQTGHAILPAIPILGLDVKTEPQTIEFNDQDDTLYWMSRTNASPDTQFRTLALNGSSILIQNLWYEAYVCLAAIGGGQPDVSWLELSASQGTVAPNESLEVEVLLDPEAFDMPPGVYQASLVLIDNAPDTPNQKRHGKIPVILTIIEPDLNFNAPSQAMEGDTLPITLTFDADSDMTGHPIAEAADILIDLPADLSLVNGSLSADYGEVSYNAGNHQILWQTPDPLNDPPEVVNLTYQVLVETGTHGQTLTQQASLSYAGYSQTSQAETEILNRAPQLDLPLPDQQTIVRRSFAYIIPAGSFSDADNDLLTYTATGLPPGILLSSNGSFSGAAQQSGSFTVTVRATDPFGDYAEDSFTLRASSALYLPGIQR